MSSRRASQALKDGVRFIAERESNARTYARTFDRMLVRGISVHRLGCGWKGLHRSAGLRRGRLPSATTMPMSWIGSIPSSGPGTFFKVWTWQRRRSWSSCSN